MDCRGEGFQDIRKCVYTPSVLYAFSAKFVVDVSSSYAHTIVVTRDGHVYGGHGSMHAGDGAWGTYNGMCLRDIPHVIASCVMYKQIQTCSLHGIQQTKIHTPIFSLHICTISFICHYNHECDINGAHEGG